MRHVSTRNAFWTIVRRDIRAELLHPVALCAVAAFGTGALVAMRLTLNGTGTPPEVVRIGVLWVVMLFATLTGGDRVMRAEDEAGSWDALLLSPLSRTAVFLAKVLSTAAILWIMSLTITLVYAALFAGAENAAALLTAVGIVTISVLGLASTTVLVAAVTRRATNQHVLAAVMLLPLLLPLIVVGAAATINAYQGGPILQFVSFCAVYAAIFIAAGIALFPEIASD